MAQIQNQTKYDIQPIVNSLMEKDTFIATLAEDVSSITFMYNESSSKKTPLICHGRYLCKDKAIVLRLNQDKEVFEKLKANGWCRSFEEVIVKLLAHELSHHSLMISGYDQTHSEKQVERECDLFADLTWNDYAKA